MLNGSSLWNLKMTFFVPQFMQNVIDKYNKKKKKSGLEKVVVDAFDDIVKESNIAIRYINIKQRVS